MSIEKNSELEPVHDTADDLLSNKLLADVQEAGNTRSQLTRLAFSPGLQDPDRMNREFQERQGVFNPDSWERWLAPMDNALNRHRQNGGRNWRDRIIEEGGRCKSNGACIDKDGYYVPGS